MSENNNCACFVADEKKLRQAADNNDEATGNELNSTSRYLPK